MPETALQDTSVLPYTQTYDDIQLSDLFSVLPSLLESIVSSGLIAFGYAVFILSIVNAASPLPGHQHGGFFPIYVKEHFTKQTSSNPFDPYSFSHASHGVLGYIFSSWIGLDLGGGLILALTSAMLWEMLENTNFIINLFRENSGTSKEYQGDSKINIVGDVIACGLGYTMAHVGHEFAGPWFPFAWLVAVEIVLLVLIRDNMLLMGLQLLAPNKAIAEWQYEIIPHAKSTPRSNYSSEGMGGYWNFKYSNKNIKEEEDAHLHQVISF